MIRVWLDGQCLQSVSRLRGIGRYVGEFIAALCDARSEIALEVSFNTALTAEAVSARDFVRQWIPNERIHLWQGVAEAGEAVHGLTNGRRLSEYALAHHVACLAPDIALSASPFEGMHDTCVPFIGPGPAGCLTAALFFDAIPYRFKNRYLDSAESLKAYERRLQALGSFDLLLAISNFSRSEAQDLHPAVEVVNIDAGVSPSFIELAKKPVDPIVVSSLGLRSPYALYVGGLDWRKNVARVVEAFTRLPLQTRNQLQFVVAGDYPPSAERAIVTQWHGTGLPDAKLQMLGHVHDATLVQLYKQAHLVVQPSLMEGFGLTALEAMTCGTPVIAADAGALPEVLDDPDALFDPMKPAEMAERIHRVVSDPAFRQRLVERSHERSHAYSWERTAALAAEAIRTAHARHAADRKTTSGAVPDVAAIRAATFEQARTLPVPAFTAVRLLAAAEPESPGPSRLLIDVTSTCRVDHATGIQRVVNRIASHLVELVDGPEQIVLTYGDADETIVEAAIVDGRLVVPELDQRIPIRFNKSDRMLMLDSSWEFYDAHRYVLCKARLQGCEVVSTLYDLVPLNFPAFCDAGMPPVFARWFEGALQHSTAFVCISRAVADELLALLHALRYPRRMAIGYWHLGADFHRNAPAPVAAPNRKFAHPAFLMVGTLEPRKGHRVALEAFEALWKDGFEGSLVIAGKRGWGVEALIDSLTKHKEYGGRLQWVEGPSDTELQALYDSCDALVSSSFGEGFGLPLIEAALHRKPVIASDLPVFREVVGEAPATLFFDTGSAPALATAIRAFNDEQQKYAALAQSTVSTMTWAESAQQLKEVICSEQWYRIYEPSASYGSNDIASVGHVAMLRPLEPSERQGQLELIDGPVTSTVKGMRALTVRITNLSDSLWSSRGTADGRFGVCLGCRVMKAGAVLHDDFVRARFPFVMPPGGTQYLMILINGGYWDLPATSIEVELLQEGVAWWGDALQFAV